MSQLLEIAPSTESRHELLTWLNTTMPSTAPNGNSVAPMHKVEQCGNGIPYVVIAANILPIVYAPLTSASSSKMKIPAQHDFEAVANLKLLQDALQRNSIARPEVLANEMPKLIKGNFQANLQLLQWFKGLYDTLLRREGVAHAHTDISNTMPSNNTHANFASTSANKKAYVANTHTTSSSSSAGVTISSGSSTNPLGARLTQTHATADNSGVSTYGGATRNVPSGHPMTSATVSRERATPVCPTDAGRMPNTQTAKTTTANTSNASNITTNINNRIDAMRADSSSTANANAATGIARAPSAPSSPSSASWAFAPLGTSPAHEHIQGEDDNIADAWRECETINAQGNAATAAAMDILYPQQVPAQAQHHNSCNNTENEWNDLVTFDGDEDFYPTADDATKYNVANTALSDGTIHRGNDTHKLYIDANTTNDDISHDGNVHTRSSLRSAQSTPLVYKSGSRAPSHVNSQNPPSQTRRTLDQHTAGGGTSASPAPPSALRSRATRRKMLQEASDRRLAGTPLQPPPAGRANVQGAVNPSEWNKCDDATGTAAGRSGVSSRTQSHRANSLSRTWESRPQALSRLGTPSCVATSQSFVMSASNARARGRGAGPVHDGGASATRALAPSLTSSFASPPGTGRVRSDGAVAHPRANRPFIHKSDARNSTQNMHHHNSTDPNSNVVHDMGCSNGASIHSTSNNNNNNGRSVTSSHNSRANPVPSCSLRANFVKATGVAMGHSGTTHTAASTSSHTTAPKRGVSAPLLSSTSFAMRRSGTSTPILAGAAAPAQHATMLCRAGLTGQSSVRRANAKPPVTLSSSTNTTSAPASLASTAASRGYALTHPVNVRSAGLTRAASAVAAHGSRSRLLGSRTRELAGTLLDGARAAAKPVRLSHPSQALASIANKSGSSNTTPRTGQVASTLTLDSTNLLLASALSQQGETVSSSLANPALLTSLSSPSPAARAPPCTANHGNDTERRAQPTGSEEGALLHAMYSTKQEDEQRLQPYSAGDLVARRLSTDQARMASTPRLTQDASSRHVAGTSSAARMSGAAGDNLDELVGVMEDAPLVARERQFYYDKLREIELIISRFIARDSNMSSAPASVSVDHLIESIRSVLYRDY